MADQVDQKSINALAKDIIDINEDDAYIAKLAEVNNMTYNPKPIKMYIDSFGGSVYQCMGLIGVISKSQVPVHTIVTGAAMSAAFIIAISGHKRFCYNTSTYMYHQISSWNWGKLKDIEEDLEESKRLQVALEEHTLKCTKITKETLDKNYKGKKDWYMTAKQALKFGVVDEVIK